MDFKKFSKNGSAKSAELFFLKILLINRFCIKLCETITI